MKFSFFLLSLFLTQIFAHGFAPPEKYDSKFDDFFRSLPRYNLKFHRISNNWDPQSPPYFESLGLLSLPFVAFGIMIIIAGLISCCCCFCRRIKEDKYQLLLDKYQKENNPRICPLIFLIIPLIIFLIGTIFSLVEKPRLDSNVIKITDIALSEWDRFLNDSSEAHQLLIDFNMTQYMNPKTQEIVDIINQLKDITQKGKDIYQKMKRDRQE